MRPGRTLLALTCIAAAHAAAAETQVTVKTVTADAVHGDLITLSLREGAILRTADDHQHHIPLQDIVRLTTDTTVSQAPRRDFTLKLSNGGVLYGGLAGGTADAVMVETIDLGHIQIPLDSILQIDAARATHLTYRESVDWLDRTWSAYVGSTSQNVGPTFQSVGTPTEVGRVPPAVSVPLVEDLVLLTNGDIVRGFITAIGADGIAIESTFGETVVPHRLVVAVRLASGGQKGAPSLPGAGDGIAQQNTPAIKAVPHPRRGWGTLPKPPYLIVTFRNSGRLTVTDLDWSGNVVKAHLPEGQQVSIEAERIVSVDVLGGRWEWLSQHRPISFEHTPMLSLGWDYANDRNVLGGPITVAGETFEHGIGVHSRSSLTYDLKGEYGRFVTSFGIDDDSGPYADVSVSILVDGRPRFEQSSVRRGKLFGPVRLEVTQAKRIELIVDFGDNGDLQDRFNWIEPALIR